MSFGARQALATALAVAAAIAIASALVSILVGGKLRGQVEDALTDRAALMAHGPLRVAEDPDTGELMLRTPPRRGPELQRSDVFVQVVRSDGAVALPETRQVELPVSDETLAVARGERDRFFSDATVADTHVRMLTVPLGQGYALQLVRPLTEVDDLLGQIRLILLFVAVGGIGAAALLGAVVARTALRPVRRLTREAEVVAETQDLAHRIDVKGDDELARLGASFNTMLGALEQAQQAQRQLVADASHELRTPLTSLRTNIEVLARTPSLAPEKREALLRDLVGQLEELSLLVADLVDLAYEQAPGLEAVEVRLDELVQEAVSRAQRLAPQVAIQVELESCVVRGVPSRLERAIANLLDNAVKWSPPGAEIEVAVADGAVTVRDHGPGIADADVPHVFDRFYRAPSARPMPGSGLGLSIVRQVVDEHLGTVVIERPGDGGTLVRMAFPVIPPVDPAGGAQPARS
ncbi:MAG: HAMP domain-containing sensor histidine kinase [Gaiellales bacterium]